MNINDNKGDHYLSETSKQDIIKSVFTVALMLQCCVCLSVVCTECIVAKRCLLKQKSLLTAYRKSYMRNRWVPKWMTLTFV